MVGGALIISACLLRVTDLNKASTINPQPSTLNPQPSTINTQHSTLNPQLSTLNPQPQDRRATSASGRNSDNTELAAAPKK